MRRFLFIKIIGVGMRNFLEQSFGVFKPEPFDNEDDEASFFCQYMNLIGPEYSLYAFLNDINGNRIGALKMSHYNNSFYKFVNPYDECIDMQEIKMPTGQIFSLKR